MIGFAKAGYQTEKTIGTSDKNRRSGVSCLSIPWFPPIVHFLFIPLRFVGHLSTFIDFNIITMTETRNPILALVEALIRFILYLLQWIRTLITFFTLTIPSMVVKMLGYSLTLQLDFTKLVILAGAGVLGVMFWVRYKYLNKYSQLKEDP